MLRSVLVGGFIENPYEDNFLQDVEPGLWDKILCNIPAICRNYQADFLACVPCGIYSYTGVPGAGKTDELATIISLFVARRLPVLGVSGQYEACNNLTRKCSKVLRGLSLQATIVRIHDIRMEKAVFWKWAISADDYDDAVSEYNKRWLPEFLATYYLSSILGTDEVLAVQGLRFKKYVK